MNMSMKISKQIRKDMIQLVKKAKEGNIKEVTKDGKQITIILDINDKCQKYIDKRVKEVNRKQWERTARVMEAFKGM